jgi:glycosyltransferase involved in cell wall biosynthesis
LGLSPPSELRKLVLRIVPGSAQRVLGANCSRRMRGLGRRFSIAHLNMGLAAAVRPFVDMVVVAAWFYPHDLKARISSQWRHTGGNPRSGYLRRAVITAKGIALYRMDERAFRVSDLVLAPTRLLTAQLRAVGIRCDTCPPPVWLTPPGSEAPDIGVAQRSRAARNNSGLTLVTCAADLGNPRKNIGDLIQAVGHIALRGRKITLKAIGGGSRRLEKQIAMLPANANVEITGLLPRAQVHQIVKQADIFVTSSLFEEWGYAVVESLLCGTPVVAYPVYPFSEMLRDGFGTMAGEISPPSLAEAIIESADGRVRGDLAQAASDRFGATAIAARLGEIWSRTADKVITR